MARHRSSAAWLLTIAGLAAYNWWLLVPFKPGLMTSPDELFSNLEVSGGPYASIMQHLDISAGILLLAAFALLRPAAAGPVRLARRQWMAMLVFAAAGAAGGLFPEVCADGIDASCRRAEYHFELPASQYVHDVAGIVEFGAITVALVCAVLRNRGSHARPALVYRALAAAAIPAYLLLGAAYLTDKFGGVMEAVFFAGFTVMVVTHVAESVRSRRYVPRAAMMAHELAS